MKAIVLTYAPVTKEEEIWLKNTDVFKIATNFSAVNLKPNVRLTADNIVDKCLECDSCPVISCNYDLDKERVINACTLPNRHSSLLFCLDYLYLKGYQQVLLVASNPEGTATYKMNYDGVNEMKSLFYLYKYTKEGNFDIPHKTIKEFLTMEKLTDEEKLLGMTEPRPITLLQRTLFTDACKYEVHTKGYDNKSIETGILINNILSVEEKQKLINGEIEIEYNGLIIRRLTGAEPIKEPEEVNADDMSYQEMVAYVKANGIKAKSNKKADLIEAIKGN